MGSQRRAEILEELRGKLELLRRGEIQGRKHERCSSGFPQLDALLPGRGLTPGTLIECLDPGSGALTLGLAMARQLIQRDGALVIIDTPSLFFPPGAAALGIPLEKTILVRPHDRQAGLWALEQALRSHAALATLGWIEKASDKVMRRLQLAVEVGGGLGLLVRPEECRASASWAEVRLRVQPQTSLQPEAARKMQVEVLRTRGGFLHGGVILELTQGTPSSETPSPHSHVQRNQCISMLPFSPLPQGERGEMRLGG